MKSGTRRWSKRERKLRCVMSGFFGRGHSAIGSLKDAVVRIDLPTGLADNEPPYALLTHALKFPPTFDTAAN